MLIAKAIGDIARGRHGCVDLDMAQAQKVFLQLLAEHADPLQLGAFLVAERMKGESSEELAGFVLAARQSSGLAQGSTQRQGWIDLPCYAGKRRAAPAHLAAALRFRDQGGHVLVHGVADIAGRCSAWQCLQQAGVQRAQNIREAEQLIEQQGIAYFDLAELCPPLMRIYALRERLGVRSFANSVARLLNPLQCAGQLNGVFHTPYVQRMAEVNVLLGQSMSLIFMGAEGEPELYACRQKSLLWQQGAYYTTLQWPDCIDVPYPRQSAALETIHRDWLTLLRGVVDRTDDARINRSLHAMNLLAGREVDDDFLGGIR